MLEVSLTRAPTILGSGYDAPAALPESTYAYGKRDRALAELHRAEAAGAGDVAQIMLWELGLLDLILTPADDVSPYRGADYEKYAAFYRFTPDTLNYARERAIETQDVILKLHYVEYLLLQTTPRGREWIELQRELLECYRLYVDGCEAGAVTDPEGFAGLHISRALVAVGRLLTRSGLITDSQAREWAEWLVSLAEASRSFPTRDPKDTAQQRYRWIADYLVHLSDLPTVAVDEPQRIRALSLLNDAATYYQATPLNDDFEHKVAEVEGTLRKHWGEKDTHRQIIRRRFDASVRRAKFHEGTGNGLLTAHFYREARRLVAEHSQYFTADDVSDLQRSEQGALERAVQSGEFGEVRIPITIPHELMDYTRETPEATVTALLERIAESVPNREAIKRAVEQRNVETPLQSLLDRTVVSAGKVVGESSSPQTNSELDVEQQAVLMSRLLGAAVATTVLNAATAVGLTADHLVAPLDSLSLDEGTRDLIRHACERLIQKDFISALHVIVPHVEDVLRQQLKSLGVDTTEFRRDVGDGTSRTDDASLGSLMRRSLPDGRSIREHLGADVWDHLDSTLNSQTGPNLRNEFAHGLARPGHCSLENAGLALSLLFLLAETARKQTAPPAP